MSCNKCENKDHDIEMITYAVFAFAGDLLEMASKNWTEQQAKQLEWLIDAVLKEEDYADHAEAMMKEGNG